LTAPRVLNVQGAPQLLLVMVSELSPFRPGPVPAALEIGASVLAVLHPTHTDLVASNTPAALLGLAERTVFHVTVEGGPQKNAGFLSHSFPLPATVIRMAVSVPVQYGEALVPPCGHPTVTLLPLIPTTHSGVESGTRQSVAEPHVRIGLDPVSFVVGMTGGIGGGVCPSIPV
jgi:hypothetical protein